MKNLSSIKNGLNGTQIKLIAAFLMVFDHIHQALVSTPLEVPLWFTCIGRLVAPIFLFLAAEGMFYTKDRKKHLFRLYIASNLMGIGNTLIQNSFPTERFLLTNNIFSTIFVGCWFIYFIDSIIDSVKIKNTKKIVISVIGLLVPFLPVVFLMLPQVISLLGPMCLTILPNAVLSEGGFLFILLLLAFYYLRKHRLLSVLALCIVGFISYSPQSPQWMMVFASIFILAYNSEKGKGYKNFFYIFYPLHIYILYIIGWLVAGGK